MTMETMAYRHAMTLDDNRRLMENENERLYDDVDDCDDSACENCKHPCELEHFGQDDQDDMWQYKAKTLREMALNMEIKL